MLRRFCIFALLEQIINLKIMAKKSAICGEYIIQIEDSGSVVVYKIYDNVKNGLREIANMIGFNFDPDWTTRQLGKR